MVQERVCRCPDGSHNGEISTLSRSFFSWSRSSVAFSDSRFFAAYSMSFSNKVTCSETRRTVDGN
jgi:hypothetical protein